MAIVIKENTVWHTYLPGSVGFGIIGKRSVKTHKEKIDGDSLFVHKMAEAGKRPLSPEDIATIEKDCADLKTLLKKFYFEDDYIEME